VASLLGILNIDKPAGCTSRDVVTRVERLVRPAKAGHAGTLDPLASGVLVVCVGKATRLIQYVQRMRKVYHATFLLGHRSDTDDLEGEVAIAVDAPVPSREQLAQALLPFIGDLQQRPPAYSAIKIAGRRAYHLARQGRPPELSVRTITIHDLIVERYDYPELELSIECGSGTYVRALGRDIATALGTTAVMSALRRTSIGVFHVEDALAVDNLTGETLAKSMQPLLSAVADLPCVSLNEEQLEEIRHGRPIMPAAGFQRESAAIDAAGHLVAILCEKRAGELWPERTFV
jgi:tRNA pseudouridine55 synthase